MKNISFKTALFTAAIIFFPLQNIFAQDDFTSFIRKVQAKSQQSYESIESVTFKGRSKTYAYFGYRPFDIKVVPFLHEYYFDGFWQKPDSVRLVITAEREVNPDSANIKIGEIMPLPNPFQFLYDPSAFGFKDSLTNKNEPNFWPVYPFAVGADSIYSYRKVNKIGFGENKIVTVAVTSKHENIPAVNGTFQIDADKLEVVGSNVIFNEAASFTNPDLQKNKNRLTLSITGSENHTVKTEKALLYGSYWLPGFIEEEFEIHILGMKIHLHRVIEFDSYVVNPELSKTVRDSVPKISHRIEPELQSKLTTNSEHPNKLSPEEQDRIIRKIEDKLSSMDLYSDLIESDEIAREALKMGLEQRMGPYFNLAQRLSRVLIFNRVEGLRLNYGFTFSNVILPHSAATLQAGYGFMDKRWKAEAGFLYHLDKNKKTFIETNAYKTTGYEEEPKLISTGKNTFTSLLYKGYYRDYYYKTGGSIGLGFRLTDHLAMKLSYVHQKEENAVNETKISLFNYNDPFRLNPEIVEGIFRGLHSALFYRKHRLDFRLHAEYTDKQYLHSDFSFGLIKASVARQFRSGRYDQIHLFLFGAASTGKLSPQRWFDFGGKTFLNFYGNLRSVDYKTFTGDRAAYGSAEYVLYGNTLYDLGWNKKILKGLKLTAWTGFGWSELSSESNSLARAINTPIKTTDGIFTEIGLGFGDRFNILRFDFAWNRVSKHKLLFSVNLLR